MVIENGNEGFFLSKEMEKNMDGQYSLQKSCMHE